MNEGRQVPQGVDRAGQAQRGCPTAISAVPRTSRPTGTRWPTSSSRCRIRDAAWANRGFLQRAVRWMAERGIRQFIDLGAGLPTQRCTHEIAREVIPSAVVVYTDSDPGVIAHGRQILAGIPGTAVIEADFRQPEARWTTPIPGG